MDIDIALWDIKNWTIFHLQKYRHLQNIGMWLNRAAILDSLSVAICDAEIPSVAWGCDKKKCSDWLVCCFEYVNYWSHKGKYALWPRFLILEIHWETAKWLLCKQYSSDISSKFTVKIGKFPFVYRFFSSLCILNYIYIAWVWWRYKNAKIVK